MKIYKGDFLTCMEGRVDFNIQLQAEGLTDFIVAVIRENNNLVMDMVSEDIKMPHLGFIGIDTGDTPIGTMLTIKIMSMSHQYVQYHIAVTKNNQTIIINLMEDNHYYSN